MLAVIVADAEDDEDEEIDEMVNEVVVSNGTNVVGVEVEVVDVVVEDMVVVDVDTVARQVQAELIRDGRSEHAVAYVGNAVVAIRTAVVYVEQKASAVAPWCCKPRRQLSALQATES